MKDTRKTMTLNLTDAEMEQLADICKRKDLTKTAVLRQALRLYQLVDCRLLAGEKIISIDDHGKTLSELMIL